jgi:hypothetical protein
VLVAFAARLSPPRRSTRRAANVRRARSRADRPRVRRLARYQHEHHDRSRLQADIAPIQADLRALLEDAGRKRKRTRLHRRFANNLLKVWPALWTFTTHAGVEPTNNPAERALRGPVIHRKLSHGTRSDDGERFAERALSAAATCRQQKRSLFDYLTELPHRPQPRGPPPRTRLSPRLNGYWIGEICKEIFAARLRVYPAFAP